MTCKDCAWILETEQKCVCRRVGWGVVRPTDKCCPGFYSKIKFHEDLISGRSR